MRRDADGVRQVEPVQHQPKRAHVAKRGVREHGGHPEATRADLPNERLRLSPLLLKGDLGGDARLRACRRGHPRDREIQRHPHQVRACARPQRGGDRRLAIDDLSLQAGILPGDADRRGALFEKRRRVDQQRPFALRQHLAHATTPHAVGRATGRWVMKCWNAW